MIRIAGDSHRNVQFHVDLLARDADLAVVGDPSLVRRRPRRPDGRPQRVGQVVDDLEAVRAAEAEAAGDDPARLREVRLGDVDRLDVPHPIVVLDTDFHGADRRGAARRGLRGPERLRVQRHHRRAALEAEFGVRPAAVGRPPGGEFAVADPEEAVGDAPAAEGPRRRGGEIRPVGRVRKEHDPRLGDGRRERGRACSDARRASAERLPVLANDVDDLVRCPRRQSRRCGEPVERDADDSRGGPVRPGQFGRDAVGLLEQRRLLGSRDDDDRSRHAESSRASISPS